MGDESHPRADHVDHIPARLQTAQTNAPGSGGRGSARGILRNLHKRRAPLDHGRANETYAAFRDLTLSNISRTADAPGTPRGSWPKEPRIPNKLGAFSV